MFSQLDSLESVQSLLSCLVGVFCLAEVSLFCFDRSVVALHCRASVCGLTILNRKPTDNRKAKLRKFLRCRIHSYYYYYYYYYRYYHREHPTSMYLTICSFALIQWITFPKKTFFNIFHVAGIHTGVPHFPGRHLIMSISQQSSLKKFLPAKSQSVFFFAASS